MKQPRLYFPIRQQRQREELRRLILEEGRYPIEIVTGALNKFSSGDRIFDGRNLGTTLSGWESDNALPGLSMKSHTAGNVVLTSLNESGILAVLRRYHEMEIVGDYSIGEVREFLKRKKREYLDARRPLYSF